MASLPHVFESDGVLIFIPLLHDTDLTRQLTVLCKNSDCGQFMRLLISALVEHLPKHTDFIDISAAVLESVPLQPGLARHAADALLAHYSRSVGLSRVYLSVGVGSVCVADLCVCTAGKGTWSFTASDVMTGSCELTGQRHTHAHTHAHTQH